MIKNKFKIMLIILMLGMLVLHISYSYAIEKTNIIKEMSFFEVEKNEVAIGEKIKMTVNIDKVKFEKFEFNLQSDCNISNLEINENDINIRKENNEIIMNIDKNTSKLETIDLYYEIPEDIKVNDKIKFKATVTCLDEKENDENQNEIENNDESMDIENESETIEIEVKIIEKNNDEKKDNEKENELEDKKNEEKQVREETSTPNNKEKKSDQMDMDKNIKMNSNINNVANEKKLEVPGKSVSTENIQSEIVIYNGSENNYLKELTIENYSLNKVFTKENSTYFITLSDDIDSLNIIANAEEDTAIVCIYGNENLNKGTNKILISVTAENGNTRNYRIYVTKN